MTTPKPPSGRTIWEAIRTEMEDNLYRLPFSTLAPGVYHVYLHPDDYAIIEGIVPRIIGQAQRALNEEVQKKNDGIEKRRSARLARFLPASPDRDLAPIEMPPSGWQIHIQPDRDGQLLQGHMGIVSRLALPIPPEYEGGTPTTRIVKTVIGDGTRTRSTSEIAEPRAEVPVSGGATAAPAPAPAKGVLQSTASEVAANGNGYARFTYQDDDGPHTFVMRKDEISVGRGGTAAWVDITLAAGPKVSREHFRLRRDRTGRFFLRDLSTWGTWLNGEQVPGAIRTADGVTHPGPEREVPPSARIDLAETLTIEFRAEPQP